ncbi:MAG: hypothetical protein NTX79_05080 [Candidatus Micrarchaeota archaeon]|nr:hypothetical protein [Candidatus Micrarchaeota archaeon]
MRKANRHQITRAFWSIDAAFALVLAVAMFAMFSAMLYAEGMVASRDADETSGVLLSARFSSYALVQAEGGKEVDLQAVLERTGRKYASLRLSGSDGESSFAYAGEKAGAIYCTQRLYARGGNMVKLEACVG